MLRLALDTGATGTLINMGMLVSIGYDPALVPDRIQVTTGSGIEFVPRITLSKIAALGQERVGFPVLCHTLPPSTGIDGILGLDFFRGHSKPHDDSDVDLLVEFEPGQKTFDHFMALSFVLAEILQRRIELVTLEGLSPYLGPHILQEVGYVAFGA